MKRYVLFGFLSIIFVLGILYFKNAEFKTGRVSVTGKNNYNLGIGESIAVNGNSMELEDLDDKGIVKIYVNSNRYIIENSGKFAGFEFSVVDYNYDKSRVKRKVTLSINPYKPEGVLMVGEKVIIEGKTVILENVLSSGAVKAQINGKLNEIKGSGVYEGLTITVDDFYYSDSLYERWAKLSFGKGGSVTTTTANPTTTLMTVINEPSEENSHNVFQQVINWFSGLFGR